MNRRRALIAIVAAGLGMIMIIALTAALVSALTSTDIRDTQQTNTPLIENTNRTLEIIEDCTTPGRECYDRGQKATASAIADINQVSIYAAACADKPGNQSVDEIYACVVRRLSASDSP